MNDEQQEAQEEQEYFERVRKELIPKIESSYMSLTLAPKDGVPDVKIALELGLSLWLDKPIVMILQPGSTIPNRLRNLCTEVIEDCDMMTPEGQAKLSEVLTRLAPKQ